MAASAWQQLKAEAGRYHRPASYAEDLTVHDKGFLRKYQPHAFVWVLGEGGTHLFIPDGHSRQHHGSTRAWLEACFDVYGEATSFHTARPYWYTYQDGQLQRVWYREVEPFLAQWDRVYAQDVHIRACSQCPRLWNSYLFNLYEQAQMASVTT